jgi:hypothetical protein
MTLSEYVAAAALVARDGLLSWSARTQVAATPAPEHRRFPLPSQAMKIVEFEDVSKDERGQTVYVNPEAVDWVQPADNGQTRIGLRDGRELTVNDGAIVVLDKLKAHPEGVAAVPL